jgi:hypothetical protein
MLTYLVTVGVNCGNNSPVPDGGFFGGVCSRRRAGSQSWSANWTSHRISYSTADHKVYSPHTHTHISIYMYIYIYIFYTLI